MSFTQPELLSLYDLLTNRLFEIPDYQRTYSWKKKQRLDLFRDIERVKKKESEHFMATLVCLSKGKILLGGTKFERFDIVDGQQRITSLIILLKALSKIMSTGSKEDKIVSEDVGKLLIKERDEKLILIQTNHDTSNIFSNYLRSGIKPNKKDLKLESEKNFLDAFNESEIFVKSWREQYGSISLFETIMEQLKFILHLVQDESVVYTVFEVLNSRGLEVDWIDKCKSILFGSIYENIQDKDAIDELMKEMHFEWSNIYRSIGLNEVSGDEILRFSATLDNKESLSKTLSAQDALQYYNDGCKSNSRKAIKYSQWILEVAKSLKSLKSNKVLDSITKISHVRLLKVAIDLRNDFSEEQCAILTELWEKVTFRIFGIAGKDSRSKVGDYVRLSQRIISKRIKSNGQETEFPFENVKQAILDLGEGFNIGDVITEIIATDLYDNNNWRDELRYFFYKYEIHLNKLKGINFPSLVWENIWNSSAKDTIEHIYPQSPSTKWKKKLRKKNIHRLGNLTILPAKLNIEASNKDFETKKSIYLKENRLLNLERILSFKSLVFR